MEKNIIINFLESNYKIDKVLDLELIQETDYNQAYKVITKEVNYFLRIGFVLPISEVLEEINIIEKVKEKDFSAPGIIKSFSGKLVLPSDFSKTVTLFEFIAGRVASTKLNIRPSFQEAAAAARELARLHKISREDISFERASRNALTEIEKCLQNKEKIKKAFLDADVFISELEEAKKRFLLNHEERSLVHGDFRSKNLLYKLDNSEVAVVVDFEWCFYGPNKYDLGLMLVEWSCPDGDKTFDQEMIRTIINSYSLERGQEYKFDKELKFWMYYAALCDAATYICRLAERSFSGESKQHISSYMYQKAKLALNFYL